ncbi:MAG: tetratricopeptide repeat protein [Bacteroidota bacterium]
MKAILSILIIYTLALPRLFSQEKELIQLMQTLDSLEKETFVQLHQLDSLETRLTRLNHQISFHEDQISQKLEAINLRSATYHLQFQFKKAIQSHRQKLNILARVPSRNQSLAEAHAYMAALQCEVAAYDSAVFHQEKAIRLVENAYNERHTALAIAYHGMSKIAFLKDDLQSAILYAEKAVSIMMDARPSPHPKKSEILGWALVCYKKQLEFLPGTRHKPLKKSLRRSVRELKRQLK